RKAGDDLEAGRALEQRGGALAEEGRAPEALADLEQALTLLGQGDQALLWSIGEARRGAGAFDRAYDAFQQLQRVRAAKSQAELTHPREPHLLAAALADCCERLGRLAEATDAWREVLELNPPAATVQLAWQHIVRCHTRLGDHEAACTALIASAEDPATGEGARERAGRLHAGAEIARRRLADSDRAASLLERALALD